jgi:predicted extracellular nuclease
VITAGDFNEFSFVEPMEQYAQISGLRDLDAAANIKEADRYTYVFDMNSQQLDHMYVSPALVKKAKYEHIHVSTWVDSASEISDHDPSVAKLNVCR